MTQQPRGRVSFLFTSVEDPTPLLRALGADGYHAVFDQHRRLLRAALERHGGYEAGTRGDGFFFAFAHARDAVAAAVSAQRGLAAETRLLVRMAIHTGEALLDPPDYLGLEVHRAARLMNAAHGGQVLISDPTRAALEGALPEGAVLRDLGEHWLRDFEAPQPLHQLVIDGIRSEFPQPRTLQGPERRLRSVPTRLVGREVELGQLAVLLDRPEVRLLTLTGLRGSGKTRLALAAAEQRADSHAGGVYFAALAGTSEPSRVGQAVTGALGLPEAPASEAWALVTSFLAKRDALLVLDGLDHLLDGVEPLAALMSACPRLTIVATSRTRLRLSGEREFRVPALTEAEAIELFAERASAAHAAIEVDDHVARICRAVDYLPLAIELAATRTEVRGEGTREEEGEKGRCDVAPAISATVGNVNRWPAAEAGRGLR